MVKEGLSNAVCLTVGRNCDLYYLATKMYVMGYWCEFLNIDMKFESLIWFEVDNMAVRLNSG